MRTSNGSAMVVSLTALGLSSLLLESSSATGSRESGRGRLVWSSVISGCFGEEDVGSFLLLIVVFGGGEVDMMLC